MTSSFTRFRSTETDDSAVANTQSNLRTIQENIFWWYAVLTATFVSLAILAAFFVFQTAVIPPAISIILAAVIWIAAIPRLLPYAVRVVLLLLLLSITISYSLYTNGIISGAPLTFLMIVIFAGIFLGRRLSIVLAILFVANMVVIGWFTASGAIIPNPENTSRLIDGSAWVNNSFTAAIILFVVAISIYSLLSNIQSLLSRQQGLTRTIIDNRDLLENRVKEQTRLLELTVQVGRTLSTLAEPQQLLEEVVEQIQTAFGYYHVHIYLWNENKQQLEIAGGTGEAGRTLLIGNHKLPAGRGIVGAAAATQQAVLVQDVKRDPNWVANPLLPETKTELAVPIQLDDELLGVLDVQHNVIGHLQQQDVQILSVLANQIATALSNAELYKQVQEQFKQQAIINELGQKVQFAPNITFTLQTAAQQLYQSLDANRLGITLLPKAIMPQEKPAQKEMPHDL